MKKKGFTLIELLGVISVIGAIAVIVTPIILDSINKGREKAYIEQTEELERSAEKWSIKNANLLSETEDYYLDIPTLVNENYLNSEDIIDPRNQEKMDGCIVIHYDSENVQFIFNYTENTCETLKS